MIPPKYSVTNTVGFFEREISPLNIPRLSAGETEFHRQEFWGTGYCVRTVGLYEAVIRSHIKIRNEKINVKSKYDWQVFNGNNSSFQGGIIPPALRVVVDFILLENKLLQQSNRANYCHKT